MSTHANQLHRQVGVVVIGRNEGERLRGCLIQVQQTACPLVYVDSGSTDGSLETAAATGAIVVELDTEVPFTAARARNVGWRRLVREFPDVRYLQFFDGDCVPEPDWLERAAAYLDDHPETAAVCGRRREQFRNKTYYNLLCDIEWDGPVGEIAEFGGGVMIRREALEQVDGYIDSVIAAEDTELSVRLRRSGWGLARVAADMEEHDANMTRFAQWWKRGVRSGHAHAEMHLRHGDRPIRCRSREARSALVWGLILPLVAFGFAWLTSGWSLLLLAGYLVLYARILVKSRGRLSASDARVFAASCVLAKFPEVLGLLQFRFNRLAGRQARIIEYKPIPNNTNPAQA